MRDRSLHIGCVLALSCGLVATDAAAWCQTVTEGRQNDPTACPVGGQPLAWTGSCASLSIDPRGLPDGITRDAFRTEVTTAAARWAAASCSSGTPSFHFVDYPDCAHGAEWNPRARNANVVSFRSTWGDDEYHPPDAIAVTITTFTSTTGAIKDTDTELNLRSVANPTGFRFTVGAPGSGDADLPTVLSHELGHAQGLAHSNVRSALMWFSAGRNEQRRNLDADDVDAICTVYPPGRSAPCEAEPRGGFECAQGCGCAIPGRHRAPLTSHPLLAAVLAVVMARRRSRVGNAGR